MEEGRKRYSEKEAELRRREQIRKEEEERVQKKKRREREKKKRKLFSIFFFILLIFCALIIFCKTPLFDIKEVKVEGNFLVSEEDIIKICGMEEGNNIFDRISYFGEKKIESLPYISEAKIIKKLPSHVTIRVAEEKEAYGLCFEEKYILLDKNGKSIRESLGNENLPVIKGARKGEFNMGEMVKLKTEDETETFLRTIECVNYYSFYNLTEIDLSNKHSIVLKTEGPLTIKIGSLGTEDELSYKMAYIKEVINNLPQNVSGVIDATDLGAGVSYRSTEEDREEEIEVESEPYKEAETEEEN